MKPNLLFLFTDEQRADTMAAYGNHRIHMPNLNQLASKSVVFDRAYVSQPVCTPSRSTILTGLYPHTTGCTENNVALGAEFPCLSEMVEDPSYVKAYHGKWHLGDEIFAQHGFDEWVSIEDAYATYYRPQCDPQAHSSYHRFLTASGFVPATGATFSRRETACLPEAFGKPAFLAQQASRFIRENRQRPFILYVNFLEPHMPFTGPRDDQYDPHRVPLPGNYDALPTQAQPLKTRLFQQGYCEMGFGGLPLRNREHWRRLVANYWGLCSLVDTHVGTILRALDECGLRDNTIIVYTSDHGDMMGSHRLLAKCVMFEEALRVPLLIHLPGQRTPRRIRGPVSQVDLVPTLLDLLGQPVPDHLQGQSLRSGLEAPGGRNPTNEALVEWNGPNNGFGDHLGQPSIPDWMARLATGEQIAAATTDPVRTVVTSQFKFNYSPLGEHELYDLDTDPGEVRNLARDSAHLVTMRRLADRIARWQDRTGDRIELPPMELEISPE